MKVAKKGKGPIYDPGKCRCCGAMKKCRIINVEYDWEGQKEIYSELFVDCFGLMLSHLEGSEEDRLICATCVSRLREASLFRAQVLRCEEQLLQHQIHVHIDNEENAIKTELIDVKEETPTEDLHDSTDNDGLTGLENVRIEVIYEAKTMVDIKKPAPELKEPNTRKLRRPGLKTDVSAKREMLLKMRKTREQFRKMQQELHAKLGNDNIEQTPRDEVDEKELNTFKNTITIVETSYVCPFANAFSDYLCVYCKEVFTNPDKLRQHTLTHNPATYTEVVDRKKMPQLDITRIDCRLCEQSIEDIDSFRTHIIDVHGKVLHANVNTEFITFKLTIGFLNCVECNQKFTIFHALRLHMAEHFGSFICDICGAHFFLEVRLLRHRKAHKFSYTHFPCSECGKVLKSKYSREFHIARMHKNEPTYYCNKCEEVFRSYEVRQRHKREVHGERHTFPCNLCDKVYDTKKHLREHNKRSHLKIFKHQCQLCDKRFYIPSQLREHMSVHTGERNFHCELCTKTYPRLKALKLHMQSHGAEKKYKCSLCAASYTQLNNYKNHMKCKHPLEIGSGY